MRARAEGGRGEEEMGKRGRERQGSAGWRAYKLHLFKDKKIQMTKTTALHSKCHYVCIYVYIQSDTV